MVFGAAPPLPSLSTVTVRSARSLFPLLDGLGSSDPQPVLNASAASRAGRRDLMSGSEYGVDGDQADLPGPGLVRAGEGLAPGRATNPPPRGGSAPPAPRARGFARRLRSARRL